MAHAVSRCVLIVDDSDIIRSRLQSLVRELQRDITLCMASDVRQAMQSLHSQRPDMVILDLCLPDGSGLDVLQEIKARFPGIAVAILTHYADTAYRVRCAELGADYFLDKATEFEVIREIL